MLKYIIFDHGFVYKENIIRCPNCGLDRNYLKGNIIDSVYTCTKCGCRFRIEETNNKH